MQSLTNLSSLQGLQNLPNLPNLPSLPNLGSLQPMGVQQFPWSSLLPWWLTSSSRTTSRSSAHFVQTSPPSLACLRGETGRDLRGLSPWCPLLPTPTNRPTRRWGLLRSRLSPHPPDQHLRLITSITNNITCRITNCNISNISLALRLLNLSVPWILKAFNPSCNHACFSFQTLLLCTNIPRVIMPFLRLLRTSTSIWRRNL